MTTAPEARVRGGRELGAGLIEQAIRSPVTVIVGVLLVALFGLQALFAVPIQMTPDVSRPVLTVRTFWPGANPNEVEKEIVERQEEVLKSLENLTKMESRSQPSLGEIQLEFAQGTDVDAALLKVNRWRTSTRAWTSSATR
ncbi:MAG: efflux RND transporter permease subunit [Candidatus Riflebacteria bacterium]|nr:efflux RND transporter permease subunit [Candidatus Riflebacteria bacterium]